MPVIAATHTPVNSGRTSSHRFGAGILASRPFAGYMPYTQADLDEAAAMFATSAEDHQFDALAAQRSWEDAYEAGLIAPPEFGRCLACSLPTNDLTELGLCDRCDAAADDASMASRNLAVGLGFNVF